MIGMILTPAPSRSLSANSASESSPSTVESVTSAPADLRCLATMPAPPTKSIRLSNRTLGVGVGHPADHSRVGQAIDDRVTDNMNPLALASVDDSPQAIEIEPVRFHQEEKLLKRDIRRIVLDEVRRRVDDIPRSEQEFASITLNDLELLLSLRIDATIAIFVALGEVIGLDAGDVRDRSGISIDHDEIDHFERRKIERPQLLRHERPILRLRDVGIGGQAGDQDIRLFLGVEQVTDVTGVHEIEHAMAHDHLFRARAGPDHVAKLLDRLDLPPIATANRLQHVPYSVPNASNQVL